MSPISIRFPNINLDEAQSCEKKISTGEISFGLYGKISNIGIAVLNSLSLGKYINASFRYFTVEISLG